ncbi:MAG: DNA mismatch repair protein [Sporothrix epigloea]
MSIQRLPGAAAAKLKSSTIVASLNEATLGLLRNSLDAGASYVTVQVNYDCGGCLVEDNGSGIPAAEFLPGGSLGELHCTSKYPPKQGIHGRYGAHLASTAALSLLTILSRCSHGAESTLTIHNGQVLRRHTTSERSTTSTLQRGTRVAVNNLFGCMPVRARLRPKPDSPAWNRDWEDLIQAVVALLLAWPSDITVALENSFCGTKRLFKAQGQDLAQRAARLLSQAGLCETVKPATWVRVQGSVQHIKVSGTICSEPSANKRTQFLQIGIEPLTMARRADSLCAEINKIFAESNFGAATGKNRGDGRNLIDQYAREVRPVKAVDRWPIFCLGIELDSPLEADDILDDHRQLLPSIIDLIRTMIYEFLDTHGFYARTLALYGSDEGPDMAPILPTREQKAGTRQKHANDKLPPNSLISFWPRTKSTRSTRTSAIECDFSFRTMKISNANELEATSKFFAEPEYKSEIVNNENGFEGVDCDAHCQMKDWNGNALTSGDFKISKASLEMATVIGQVDCKFVLIRAVSGDGNPGGAASEPVLILIDQHAADERCRVEDLLKDYFARPSNNTNVNTLGLANTITLNRPLQFELATNEAPILERSQAYLQYWGVIYKVLPPRDHDQPASTTLHVYGLPASIADRCRREPRLVIDLIRKEAWARKEANSTVSPRSPNLSWPATMLDCPRAILDLINSRACRSESLVFSFLLKL